MNNSRNSSPPSATALYCAIWDNVSGFINDWLSHPLSDRHYVMVSEHGSSRPRHDHYVVNWSLDDRYSISKDEDAPVLPQKFQGCWDVRPSMTGGLDAIYSVEIKPGGLIPDWLARHATQRYLVDLMAALYRRLATLTPGASEQR